MANVLERAPALGAAVAVMGAGVVAGYAGPAAGWAALAAGVGGLAGRARGAPRAAVRTARPRAAAVWIALTALAGARVVHETGALREDAAAWAGAAAEGEVRAVQAAARVESARDLGGGRWSVRATLAGCGRPCDGASVRWIWRGGESPLEGDRVRLAGRLRAEPPRAPAGSRFPPAGLAPGARRGALDGVRILTAGRPSALAGVARHLRARIEARFGASITPLAAALLLGDRDGLDPALTDAFARTGTVHILAVSGLHVGFLAGLLAFGLGLAGAGPASRAGASTLLLAAYVALVGAPPSAVRAAVMASLVLWARASERRVDNWQLWGAAAVLLLVWRPGQLFALGFALSFAAVAGLLAAAGPLEARLAPGRSGGARGPDGGPAPPAVTVLAAGLAATTAATLATLPLQAAAFGWLAPAAFLVNPALVPLAGAALPLGWLALGADAAGLGFLAAPLAHAAGAALALVQALAAGTGARPWVPGPWGWAAAAAGGALAAVVLARRRPAAALGLGAIAITLALAARPPAPAALEIAWLDVGQGDAIVLRFADGAAWLVDAGPADAYGDAGRRVVLPYLRRAGIRRIDRLITTHPDLDHVGGAATVVEGIPVHVWSSGGPVDDGPAWLALLAEPGPRPEVLVAGARLHEGRAAIDVLHPGPGWVPADPYAGRYGPNEGSVVLLVSDGRCRALLTGDLGAPAEAALVAALGDSLQAALLHAGHHGSRHSSTAPFLARVRPRDVVVSAGGGNRYGHPHPDALGRFTAAGATVWRTDRLGTVRAVCGPRGWHLSARSVYLR